MGPFKCPDCGVWWAGFEHRCRMPVATTGTITIQPDMRDAPPPTVIAGDSSLAPWCGLCRGRHIPGSGPCTGTWSGT